MYIYMHFTRPRNLKTLGGFLGLINFYTKLSKNYHLFASLGHALAEKRFTSYENVREWLDNWFDLKDEQFYWRGIHHLPERWEKCVNNNGAYFE